MTRVPYDIVFLDRDGTINRKAPEGRYVTSPDEFELLPGAADAIRALNEADVKAVVVTNQRGIARGLMSESALQAVHARMASDLAAARARVDAIYYCPHDHDSCTCRKPGVGLFIRAFEDFPDVRRERAACVGDSLVDVQSGAALGIDTVLLDHAPERAAARLRAAGLAVDRLAPSLRAAVDMLLKCPGRHLPTEV
jgi:D-glycero-D-manno-heptose 1,7-bisphosphate phosphatase